MWKNVEIFIREHESFVLTTHIHPEGDALGSEVAMAAFLEDLGKRAAIVNSSPTPQNLKFLDPKGQIQVYPGNYMRQVLERADAVIILDVNGWKHIGPFGEIIKKSTKPRICIDHHQGADESFADIVVTDTSAAAAGVMVYDLIHHMKGKITPRIAEAIYATLIADTGTFRFSNTDERVFKIAADLCGRGVHPFTLHRNVFSKSWAAVHLLGSVLTTLKSTDDERIAWIHATQEMFNEVGADYEDSDGLLDVVRAIKGVDLCIFFKELTERDVKISLRSNGSIDAYEIARAFGGGGHRMAAGMSMAGELDGVITTVVRECLKKKYQRS